MSRADAMDASTWREAASASKGSVVPLRMRQVSTFAVMRSAGVDGGELAIAVTCRRNSGAGAGRSPGWGGCPASALAHAGPAW